jgi:hypothetical protein
MVIVMRRFFPLVILLALLGVALAQSSNPGLIRSGPVTANNCVKWINNTHVADAGTPCGVAGVTSFNTRTGAVLPQAADYSFSQISGSVAAGQLPNYVISLTGGVARTMFSKLDDTPSIKDFGAIGNGIVDDTSAFTAADATGKTFFIPCGTYNVTTVTITTGNKDMVGQGAGCVIIRSTVNNLPVFAFATNLPNVGMRGITFDRTVPAVAGGQGLDISRSTNGFNIDHLIVQNQRNGIVLGNTALSWLSNIVVQKNFADGILLQDNITFGSGLQWTLEEILSQFNDGNDFEVFCSAASCTLETWHDLYTFASTGNAILATGTAPTPIASLRVFGGFLGSNNTDLVKLDTFGGNHGFNGIFMELPGNIASGRGAAPGGGGGTPATHTGNCYNITANNDRIFLTAPYCNQPWQNGVSSSAPFLSIVGGIIQNAHNVGALSNVNGAVISMTGTICGNFGGALQQYCLFGQTGGDLRATNVINTGNAVAFNGAVSQASLTTIIGQAIAVPSNITSFGTVFGSVGVVTIPTTVGSLPACNAGIEGMRNYVTDQNTAVAYRGAVTGGGTTRQAVLCSNSVWIQD